MQEAMAKKEAELREREKAIEVCLNHFCSLSLVTRIGRSFGKQRSQAMRMDTEKREQELLNQLEQQKMVPFWFLR